MTAKARCFMISLQYAAHDSYRESRGGRGCDSLHVRGSTFANQTLTSTMLGEPAPSDEYTCKTTPIIPLAVMRHALILLDASKTRSSHPISCSACEQKCVSECATTTKTGIGNYGRAQGHRKCQQELSWICYKPYSLTVSFSRPHLELDCLVAASKADGRFPCQWKDRATKLLPDTPRVVPLQPAGERQHGRGRQWNAYKCCASICGSCQSVIGQEKVG